MGAGSSNQQPEVWMKLPAQQVRDDVPAGLLYLTTTDKILIDKYFADIEMPTGTEAESLYMVKNHLGENIYYVAREVNCCTHCGNQSSYASIPGSLMILDCHKNEVMQTIIEEEWEFLLFRKLTLKVYLSPRNLIGIVVKEERPHTSARPTFSVKNERGATIMKIIKTASRWEGMFQVFSADGTTEVAKLEKIWVTKKDFFRITFLVDLSVRSKAILIGACFFMGAEYYETRNYGKGTGRTVI